MPYFAFATSVAESGEVFEPWPDNLYDKSLNPLSPSTRLMRDKLFLPQIWLESKTDR